MQILENVVLANYTFFGSGGPADKLIVIEKTDELEAALAQAKPPLWFLGSGANVLIADQGLPGTTIHLQTSEISFSQENDSLIVIADAGVDWDTLVQATIAKDKWGLERTSGIPGSVGAAVVGNIAAYGQAVADTLQWVETIDVTKPFELVRLLASELGLGYRFSDFQTDRLKNHLVVRAAFRLEDTPRALEYASATKIADELGLDADNLSQRRKIIMEARKRIGSLVEPGTKPGTAGSFFRNPLVDEVQAQQLMSYEERGINYEAIKKQNLAHSGSATRVSAAHVLLAAGFKRGQAWGPVRLHPDHVLKLENTGGATSQDIYNVAQEIIQTVQAKLDITLEPEVRFLGEFDN